MSRGPKFIDWNVFQQVMSEVPGTNGEGDQDIKTVYGDMSRLVVAWLAMTPPEQLAQLYNELGWKGQVRTARQMHLAARHWMAQYRGMDTQPAADPEREAARAEALDQFLQLARSSSFRSAGPYPARDELHERD